MNLINKLYNVTNLEDAMSSKSDIFSFIRLFSALMVLYAHAYHIFGLGADPLTKLLGVYTGTLAVYIFFAISGFFILQSAIQRGFFQYSIARLARIFPALIIANILTVIVIVPLSNQVGYLSFIGSSEALDYVRENSFLETVKFTITGIYELNPDKAINGSLWTLPVEIRAYILASLLVLLGVTSSTKKYNAFFVLAIVISGSFPTLLPSLFPIPGAVNLLLFFCLGGVLYINRTFIFVSPLLILTVLLLIYFFKNALHPLFLVFLLVYLVISSGFVLGKLKFFRLKNDYSYGLYLYAYPVSQFAYVYFNSHGFKVYFLSIVVLTFIFAIFSWHFVEQPINRVIRAHIFPRLKKFTKCNVN